MRRSSAVCRRSQIVELWGFTTINQSAGVRGQGDRRQRPNDALNPPTQQHSSQLVANKEHGRVLRGASPAPVPPPLSVTNGGELHSFLVLEQLQGLQPLLKRHAIPPVHVCLGPLRHCRRQGVCHGSASTIWPIDDSVPSRGFLRFEHCGYCLADDRARRRKPCLISTEVSRNTYQVPGR